MNDRIRKSGSAAIGSFSVLMPKPAYKESYSSRTGMAYAKVYYHDRRGSLQPLVSAEGLEVSPANVQKG
jgi:hypothetical protein